MLTPTLNEFASILETLATDPRGCLEGRQNGHADWVRSGIAIAGTKLRALEMMLRTAPRERPARLLDVGAQVGSLAAYAARLGFAAAAADLEPYAKRFGPVVASMAVDYRACDLSFEPLPFPEEAFDFVTYLDVIEHHAFSPKRVLREIHRVLAPGGRLVLSTPNHASIFNRISLLAGRSVNDNFAYFFDDCAEAGVYAGHHREYTLRELREALERTSFRVVWSESTEENPVAVLRVPARGKYWHAALAMAGRTAASFGLPLGRVLVVVGEKASP